MATVTHNITTIRGDTVYSPKWFITEQDLAPGIEYNEIKEGLDNGTYTLISLDDYEIRGHIRDAYQSALIVDLPLVIEDDALSFELPYSFTEQFDNTSQQLIYDIEFTHKVELNRVTWIAGNIAITQDVTYD